MGGITDAGIGSYLASMYNRPGSRGDAAQLMQRNAYSQMAAESVRAGTLPEQDKNEGAVKASDKIPPASDVGRIMDFKV